MAAMKPSCWGLPLKRSQELGATISFALTEMFKIIISAKKLEANNVRPWQVDKFRADLFPKLAVG